MSYRARVRLAFAVVAVLALFAVTGAGGPLAGVASLAAQIGFILACAATLRGTDETMRSTGERVGVAGLLGRWF